jgi:hypothetical protein
MAIFELRALGFSPRDSQPSTFGKPLRPGGLSNAIKFGQWAESALRDGLVLRFLVPPKVLGYAGFITDPVALGLTAVKALEIGRLGRMVHVILA